MTNFGDWLKPTLLGPQLVMWVTTTLGAILVGMHALSGGRFDSWLLGMLFASFFAAGISVLLLGADVILLKAGRRKLPTGGRAWLSSCLAPFGVFAIWSLPWPPPESVLGVVIFLTAPMAASALLVRALFGDKP
ncbi:MAG: hypothetical protein IT378_13525 [Sandaracinaceae bacterium]|nr:hypothetical protein [Sandaracinaceae bacterium]